MDVECKNKNTNEHHILTKEIFIELNDTKIKLHKNHILNNNDNDR